MAQGPLAIVTVFHPIREWRPEVKLKFSHRKFNLVVLYSFKFTFQIVIFHISDSKPLADFVFKLFYKFLGYTAFKIRQQVFFYEEQY